MVLLFENGFSGWGQFLQSFCRSTREYVISLVALPLVLWQIHLCSCKTFAKIVPIQKNYIAKFFNGDDLYLPIIYDEKSGYFVIEEIKGFSMETQKFIFRFLDCTNEFNAVAKCVPDIISILNLYGILENHHYTVDNNQLLKWNTDYVFKYTNSELSERTKSRVPT